MTTDSKKGLALSLAAVGSAILLAVVVFAAIDYFNGQEVFALAYTQGVD